MQEKVEKYIYYISENRYRVKFLRIDKKTNRKIRFDQYIDGTIVEAMKLRDDKLKENEIRLTKIKVATDIFETIAEDSSIEKVKKEKTEKVKRNLVENANPKKVDKYIYEIEKGKKYRIFIRKGGTKGQKGDYYSAVFEGTLAQARKERDLRLAELKLKNGKGQKGNIRFIDFARIYYREYAEKELSPTTVNGDKTSLKNYVFPEIANTKLNKIDALTIQRIINKLKERNRVQPDKNGNIVKLAPSTVNGVYRLLRKILNKAIAWGYLETNPVLQVKSPEVSKTEKKSYNKEELLGILELLKKEGLLTETLYTMAICTGIRRSELLGLHIEDIDLDNNMINIQRNVVWDKEKQKLIEKETKTKGSVRKIPMPRFCTEVIVEYLKLRERIIHQFKQKDKNYVPPRNLFLGKTGGIMFPDTASSKWSDFKNRHKSLRDVSLHGLRHSYCSMQMNENDELAPADVQKLMGHSQLSTTFGYTHSNKNKVKEAVSVFDSYNTSGEIKVNFCQIISLYKNRSFTCSKEIKTILEFIFNSKNEKDYILNLIVDYIDVHYPAFKNIDISKVNINNVWDWLEEKKAEYGNEFIMCPLV